MSRFIEAASGSGTKSWLLGPQRAPTPYKIVDLKRKAEGVAASDGCKSEEGSRPPDHHKYLADLACQARGGMAG